MNRNSSDSSDRSDIENVVDLVCREFERKFREEPTFRIENLLDGIQHQFQNFESKLDHYKAKHRAIAELIFVEMEMRWTAGQPIDAAEYLRRFPDFGTTIEESLNRLIRQHISFRETCFLASVFEPEEKVVADDGFELRLDLSSQAGIPDELGPFREISQIKSGSFGIVCRAIDSRNGRTVALKFPRKDKLSRDPDLRMFLAEANRAMKLDHPGIVKTYAIEKSNGYLAIVQELIDGPDLSTAKTQLRGPKDIARLIAFVADALAYAHQKGVYHRDLKPANILVDRQGRPHVVDFGLAITESELIYVPGHRCGTAYYMPPEQVAGLTRLLDGRSDIWSLGVILYELLTKDRPFKGITEPEIFAQIENKDPRPLRQIDDSIDPELQRICLKCLEKYQRDRYLTADELASDLRHWAALPAHKITPSDAPAPFLPKGLRSYSAEDAQFFLDLLPGPRDRYGIPGSIRFWESRICEPVPPANRVPVGVIFGPSGSGKSSFIKAGLLPLLAPTILTVYVEATQADTEVRLLKALRQRLDGLPEKISLPELLRGLSSGRWRPTGFGKILIVIDQFEQWLSRSEDFATSQLARAMRFCDGQQVQCLLLTRDDFMMALSRFADALEMDVREGENAQAIDLFDKKHARKVLAKLGRAYERLPAEPAELSDAQEAFLKETVDQFAADDYVICVHLVLFSEMFRQRPWTTAELKQVGGVAGTGEKFLEATFGASSRDKRLRSQHDSAQRVLEALLPTAGSDIRGAMKPEGELMAAAKLQNQPAQFDELIKSLDGQLKLITRTDPDLPQEVESRSAEPSDRNGFFQLTHDYLVPSIRSWLDSTLGMTRAGRARLRLRDLGSQVIPGQPPRNLPTNLEWLAWQFQLHSSGLNSSERVVMSAARTRFLRQAGAAISVLILISALAAYALYQIAHHDRITKVKGLINNLLHLEFPATPAIVDQLTEHRAIAEPLLRAIVNDTTRPPNDRLRASMGVLPFDKDNAGRLVEAVTAPDGSPERLKALVAVLARHATDFNEDFAFFVESSSTDPRTRFRAACAEILIGQAQRDWTRHAEMIATALWEEPIAFVDSWIEILKAKGAQFDSAFTALLTTPDNPTNKYFLDSSRAFALASALYSFKGKAGRESDLASLIPPMNDVRFGALLSVVEKHGTGPMMADELEMLELDANDAVGQANRAIALARLERPTHLLELFGQNFENEPTFFAINFATSMRLRLHTLREIYETNQLQDSVHTDLRRSVLQAMALHSYDIADAEQRNWLADRARHHVLNDRDACCFSTAELIMRRLNMDSVESLRAERRMSNQVGKDVAYGNVLINERLQAYSIVELTLPDGGHRKIAIATTELTNGELAEYLKQNGVEFDGPRSATMPFNNFNGIRGMTIVLGYCNSLSKDKFYPSELTVPNIKSQQFDPNNLGYRLPTTDEWMAGCASNRVLEGRLECWPRLATNYAWVYENSQNDVRDVCRLLPNAAGLFDTFGNVSEVCHTLKMEYPFFVEKGQSWRAGSEGLKVATQYEFNFADPSPEQHGFRIVTTMQVN